MTAPFRHDQAGNQEQDWARQPWLAELPELALPDPATAIVLLAAHPDDESLGAGGLIAAAARAGHRIAVVIASDGEGSHPHSRTVTPAQLRGLRRAEAAEAVAELAPVGELSMLGLPDGRLGEHLPAISRAVEELLGTGPAWLITPWEQDGHPDHAACDRAAQAVLAGRPAVRQFAYPIWWWHWTAARDVPIEQRRRGRRFPLAEPVLAAKRAALDRYRSQTRSLGPAAGDQPVLTGAMLSHFDRDYEVFFDRGERPAGRAGYFDALYATEADPWRLADHPYERRKRAVLLASLPSASYRRAFEPGCANGDLSTQLAGRCDELVCTDVAPAAVERAADRLRDQPHVRIAQGRVPDDWPDGMFDLIVLSEVGYYCEDLAGLADRITRSLAPDGTLALVHWRWPAVDHPLTAESVHATIGQRCGLLPIVDHREADFLLQVLTPTGRSVAQQHRLVP